MYAVCLPDIMLLLARHDTTCVLLWVIFPSPATHMRIELSHAQPPASLDAELSRRTELPCQWNILLFPFSLAELYCFKNCLVPYTPFHLLMFILPVKFGEMRDQIVTGKEKSNRET